MWEYKIILKDNFYGSLSQEKCDEEEKFLTELGKEGWLIVNVNNNVAVGRIKYTFVREIK